MKTRLFVAAALAALLAGCATYSNDYRDQYADGSYYSPADGGNGDYYYAPERSDPYYSYGYDRGYYDYRYSLGPIGYGRFDGYCSVQFSSCAPYWYGYSSYSPSYRHFGFSLFYGSNRWFDPWGPRRPYYSAGHGYGYRSAPIYRDLPRASYPPGGGSRPGPPPSANGPAYPGRQGNYTGWNTRRPDPTDTTDQPGYGGRPDELHAPRPLYRANRPIGPQAPGSLPRPMPKPYPRMTPPDQDQERPAPVYRPPPPEPRSQPAPPAWRPEPSSAPSSDPADASAPGGRIHRNRNSDDG
jgi:hypothetical protein